MRDEPAEGEVELKYPSRGTFFGCWAAARWTEAKVKPTSKVTMVFIAIPAPVYCGSLPFVQDLFNPWLRQVNKKIVESFLDSRISARSKQQISPDRYNSERQILNDFFTYLIGEHVFKENPCRGIEKKKIVKNKAKISLSYTQEAQLDKWLSAGEERQELVDMKAKGISPELREELARVKTVAINTGLRARELVNT